MLIRKLVVDFIFMLTELFSLVVTGMRRYERILTENRRS